MRVFIVMQRGEELPDSAYFSEVNANTRASQLGAPEDATVWAAEIKESLS